MRLDVVTIFPDYLEPLRLSLVGKAVDAGLVDLRVHDLRAFTHDRHRTVDDTPYGGGPGMVMSPLPWGEALDAVAATDPALLPYAQICGAHGAGPAASPEEARAEGVRARLLPDEGDLPVHDFVAALPSSTILAVEAPLAGQADPADPLALAVSMLASSRRVAGEGA